MNIKEIKIENDNDYIILVKVLDLLIDNIGQNENHTLVPFLMLVGEMVSEYETKNYPEPEFTSVKEKSLIERIDLYEAQEIIPENPFYDALDDVYNLAMGAHNFYKNSHLYIENKIILQEQHNALAIVHDYLINHPLIENNYGQ